MCQTKKRYGLPIFNYAVTSNHIHLRQYFPKGRNFKNVTEEGLAFAVKKLNHRPRKCLDYQSPHEVFRKTQNGALAT